jgi:hypothetical protein
VTVGQGAARADVMIRTSPRDWVQPVFLGGFGFVLAALALWTDQLGFALYWLVFGCLMVVEGLWSRTFGVDLTPESANLRGIRDRSVPLREVQAVVRHRRLGTWCVQLILESGKALTLRAPTTWWGFGATDYERDFNRIGRWWLEHRGASWRPPAPPAP